jgi:hypothetical protein
MERLPGDLALPTAQLIPDPDRRKKALVRLAGRLKPPQAGQVARAVTDPASRAAALAFAASGTLGPESWTLLREALTTAEVIRHDQQRAVALIGVARCVPREQYSVRYSEQIEILDRVVQAARSIRNAHWRSRALAAVVARLPAAQALAVADEIPTGLCRLLALSDLAERLPAGQQEPLLRRVIEEAGTLPDPYWRACLQVAAANRFPDPERETALQRLLDEVAAIPDSPFRSRVLGTLAERLPGGMALRAANLIPDETPRVAALSALVERLPADLAVQAAAEIPDYDTRARALVACARRLDGEQRLAVLRLASQAASAIADPYWRSTGLAAVVGLLSPDQALATATTILDHSTRADALLALAARPPETRPTDAQLAPLLQQAHLAAQAVADIPRRVRLLLSVADVFPPEQRSALLREAREAAEAISEAGLQAESLLSIAERLPAAQSDDVVRRVLEIVQTIPFEWSRWEILETFSRRFSDVRALQIALAIDNNLLRSRALIALVERLPAELALQAADEAIAISITGADAQIRTEVNASLVALHSWCEDGNRLRQWLQGIAVEGRTWLLEALRPLLAHAVLMPELLVEMADALSAMTRSWV